MEKNQYSGIIFDFDGVLVDSAEIAFQILAEIATRKGIPPLTREFLRNSKSEVVAKALRLNPIEIFFYLIWARRRSRQLFRERGLHFFPEVLLVLQGARKNFQRVLILSTNSQSLIGEQLKANNLLSFFDEIRGSVPIFGKTRSLCKLVRKWNLNPEKSFYLGDESRDVEAAKSANLNSIAVTWGYHSKELLLQQEPTFCVDSLTELSQVLLQIR